MIIYISESLNSKKNGGSSLSGLDFLQLLRICVNDLVVISNDGLSKPHALNFFGKALNPVSQDVVLKPSISKQPIAVREILRRSYYILKSFGLKKRFVVSEPKTSTVFVNSWSAIIQNDQIVNFNDCLKICIVRGNPESFIYQGATEDPDKNIKIAADYLNRFDHLIFVSSIGLAAWEQYLRPQIKTHYLPNSIDEDEVSEVIKNNVDILSGDYGDLINLVAVGSIQTRKGQDLLIPVAKFLKSKGVNFKIHLIGNVSTRWGGKEIIYDIKNSEVSKNFVIHGHRENALQYVNSADICLFPTRAEAFPRSIAEYMALSKPIVTTNASGIPEMICDGVNGLMCDVDDEIKFSNHVLSLINDPDLRRKLGNQAHVDYFKKFSKRCQIESSNGIIGDILQS